MAKLRYSLKSLLLLIPSFANPSSMLIRKSWFDLFTMRLEASLIGGGVRHVIGTGGGGGRVRVPLGGPREYVQNADLYPSLKGQSEFSLSLSLK